MSILLNSGTLAAAGQNPDKRPRIVTLGDSLTSSPSPRDAYPAVLQQLVRKEGYNFEVVDAGVGGDTTTGALRRLEKALQGDVRILVLALGANDGLRGVPVATVRKNLETIVETARKRNIQVLLC